MAGADQAGAGQPVRQGRPHLPGEGRRRSIVRGVERDKARILIGPDAFAFDPMVRTLGARYQPLVEAFARRQLATVSGLRAR